jgi:hypothetical protein
MFRVFVTRGFILYSYLSNKKKGQILLKDFILDDQTINNLRNKIKCRMKQ